MKLDDFKPQWQQRHRDLDGNVDHVIEKVRIRMSSFDKTIWWRDMRESGAAVLLFVWYGFSLLTPGNWLATCGTVIGMMACALIVAVMYWTRKKGRKESQPSLAVEEYCKAELTFVDWQIWLLRNVHWWCLGPLFVGMYLQYVALGPVLGQMVTFLITVGSLGGFIYWLNQLAVRKRLLPLRQELTDAMDADNTGAVEKDSSSSLGKVKGRRTLMVIGVLATGAAALTYFSQQIDVGWDPGELSAEEVAGIEIDDELRARLTGRYQLNSNFIFNVEDQGGHLMVGITNQSTQEVFPDSATRWSYRSVEATLEFKLHRSGPAKRLILHQNGLRQSAVRVGK